MITPSALVLLICPSGRVVMMFQVSHAGKHVDSGDLQSLDLCCSSSFCETWEKLNSLKAVTRVGEKFKSKQNNQRNDLRKGFKEF